MQKPRWKVETEQTIAFPKDTLEGEIDIVKFSNDTGTLYTAFVKINNKSVFTVPNCKYTDECSIEQIRSNIIRFCRWLKPTIEHMKKIKDARNNKK